MTMFTTFRSIEAVAEAAKMFKRLAADPERAFYAAVPLIVGKQPVGTFALVCRSFDSLQVAIMQ
eukprot:SAG31_NODE_5606_length_2426_cov_1.296089_2_plen_64_part_00